MKSWHTYEAKKPNSVKQIFKWYGYKNGEVFGPFDSRPPKYKHTEMVCTNKEEYDEYRKELRTADRLQYDAWFKDLREEYSYLSNDEFQLCYERSYDDGHSSGYDEVANEMIDNADFIDKIRNVTLLSIEK